MKKYYFTIINPDHFHSKIFTNDSSHIASLTPNLAKYLAELDNLFAIPSSVIYFQVHIKLNLAILGDSWLPSRF